MPESHNTILLDITHMEIQQHSQTQVHIEVDLTVFDLI